MEGEKDRKKQQQRQHQEEEKLAQGRSESGHEDRREKMDPTVKTRLTRESIVNGGKEASMLNITENPDHVLAFSRSVYKIDSSLE